MSAARRLTHAAPRLLGAAAAAAALAAPAGAQRPGARGAVVPGAPGVREARAPAGARLDAAALRDTALAGLVRAEARFMADVAARGADGWADAFAESGAMFPPGGDVTVGPAAARRLMARVFADPSVRVAWHPVYAAVAASGDLGYTYGYYRWTARDSTGAPARPDDGKFLTVWRRDAAGRWRVAADLGSAGPVPAGFFDAGRR